MKQVVMPFDGRIIDTVTGEDGKPWISVRSVCEAIGIASNNQIIKVKANPTYRRYDIISPSAGGPQEMLCIPLDQLNLWLGSINPMRTQEPVRSNLIAYQRECAQVLYNHFMPNGVQDLQPFMDKLTNMDMKLDHIIGATEAVWGDDKEEVQRLVKQVAELYQVDGRTVWGWIQTDCDVGSYKRQNRKIINYLKNKLGKGLTVVKGEHNGD